MGFRRLGLRFIVFCLAVPAMIIPFFFTKTISQTPETGLVAGSPGFLKVRILEHAGKSLRPAPDGLGVEKASSGFGRQAGTRRVSNAIPLPEVSPQLREFAAEVENGDGKTVRGMFVEGTLALPVIQQPARNSAFVSSEWGLLTEFTSAHKNGVTGLLAHNFLSGGQFYSLDMGQEIWIVYGDGTLRRYRVQSIDQYQKLNPASLQSDLVQLSTGKKVSTSQVFNQFYKGEHRLTLQTCLEKDGISNWGLTFWTAVPAP